MRTNTLLLLFFLGVISLWNVECNNWTLDARFVFKYEEKLKPSGGARFVIRDKEKPATSGAQEASSSTSLNVWKSHKCVIRGILIKHGAHRKKERADVETGDESNHTSEVISDKDLPYVHSPWLTIFAPLVYTFVFLLSLPFNMTAIWIFLFKIHLKKPSVVFMLNLAVADVLFATFLPFVIVYRFSGNNWVIGEGMCRFVTASFYCNMYCSILLMASISVDRFLAVVYPFQSLTWRTVGRAWLVCLVIWMVSFANTVPLLLNTVTVHFPHLNITTCYDMLEMKDVQGFYFHYFIAFISAFFLLPFIVTTFCYIVTIRSLSSLKSANANKRSRSIFLCATVLFEFVICFGPTNVIFFIYYLSFHKSFGNSLYFVYIISGCISSISCCLDPIIYYYGSSRCRRLVYRLVCCDKSMDDRLETYDASRTTGRMTSTQTL